MRKFYMNILHTCPPHLSDVVTLSSEIQQKSFYRAMLYASAVIAMTLCPSVCPSVCLSVTSRCSTETAKRIGSQKQHHTIAQGL